MSPQQRPTPPAQGVPGRRPYARPVIEESGSFERVVLGCTKTPAEADADPGGSPCSPLTGGEPSS